MGNLCCRLKSNGSLNDDEQAEEVDRGSARGHVEVRDNYMKTLKL